MSIGVSEIEGSGFIELPVWAMHVARVRDLPEIHRDPFDRILVARAMSELLRLTTADAHLAVYSELVVTV